jgi:hypothetical protein
MPELSEKMRALADKTESARGDTLRALAKDLEDKIAGRYAEPQTSTFGEYLDAWTRAYAALQDSEASIRVDEDNR